LPQLPYNKQRYIKAVQENGKVKKNYLFFEKTRGITNSA